MRWIERTIWVWPILLGLVIIFSGCTALDTRQLPPVELLQDCPAPAEDLSTNGGLARARNDWKKALQECNIDKKALREWAES